LELLLKVEMEMEMEKEKKKGMVDEYMEVQEKGSHLHRKAHSLEHVGSDSNDQIVISVAFPLSSSAAVALHSVVSLPGPCLPLFLDREQKRHSYPLHLFLLHLLRQEVA
jgi:hypothetical protein